VPSARTSTFQRVFPRRFTLRIGAISVPRFWVFSASPALFCSFEPTWVEFGDQGPKASDIRKLLILKEWCG